MFSFIYSLRKVLIMIIYVVGLLLLGEFHPFSRFPMYDSFPNWSYVFYYTDDKGDLIPCKKLHADGGALAHTFYSVINNKGFEYGYAQESEEELAEVGKEMTDIILTNAAEIDVESDSIFLHRTNYFLKEDSIYNEDMVIHKRILE